jgi:hypothetical protein
MRKVSLFLVGLSTLCLTACGSSTKPSGSAGSVTTTAAVAAKPADLIIGTWEIVDEKKKGKLEFVKGGEIIMTAEPDPAVKGKYNFVEDDLVEVEFVAPGGEKKAQKLKVKVDKDTLETTDEAKKVDKFKRAK